MRSLARHSPTLFPVKHMAVPPLGLKETDALDFITVALGIWQAGVRAENWPLMCYLLMPVVSLVPTFWAGLRQPQQII